MNFINKLLNNRKEESQKGLPEFTITSNDLKKHNFYKNGKHLLHLVSFLVMQE